MFRASEERSGEGGQGGWVDFHMEACLKVKVMGSFSVTWIWHFFLPFLASVGLRVPLEFTLAVQIPQLERRGLSSSIQAARTECHGPGAYRQQKIISHSSGGWQVQDHGTGRVSVW